MQNVADSLDRRMLAVLKYSEKLFVKPSIIYYPPLVSPGGSEAASFVCIDVILRGYRTESSANFGIGQSLLKDLTSLHDLVVIVFFIYFLRNYDLNWLLKFLRHAMLDFTRPGGIVIMQRRLVLISWNLKSNSVTHWCGLLVLQCSTF